MPAGEVARGHHVVMRHQNGRRAGLFPLPIIEEAARADSLPGAGCRHPGVERLQQAAEVLEGAFVHLLRVSGGHGRHPYHLGKMLHRPLIFNAGRLAGRIFPLAGLKQRRAHQHHRQQHGGGAGQRQQNPQHGLHLSFLIENPGHADGHQRPHGHQYADRGGQGRHN